MSPISIKLFLTTGNPTGLRTAEISNWSGKAVAAPRTELDSLRKRSEVQGAGVYLLTGVDANLHDPILYVGESENIAERLKQHADKADKEFWVHTLVFVSKDDNLSKAHIRYLESRLIHMAQLNPQIQLENRSTTTSKLSEADSAEMEGFLERIIQLLPVLGVHFFSDPQSMLQHSDTEPKALQGTGTNINAQGYRTDDGFLILKGSIANKNSHPSCPPSIIKLRKVLLQKGILKETENHWVFNQNFETSSPSTAAALIIGGSTNGLTFWRNAEGQSLKELGE